MSVLVRIANVQSINQLKHHRIRQSNPNYSQQYIGGIFSSWNLFNIGFCAVVVGSGVLAVLVTPTSIPLTRLLVLGPVACIFFDYISIFFGLYECPMAWPYSSCGKTKIGIIADEINPAEKTRDDSKSCIAQLGNASLAPNNALVRLASALSQVGPRSSAIHASVLASTIRIIKSRVWPYWCYTWSEGRRLIATKQRRRRGALSSWDRR